MIGRDGAIKGAVENAAKLIAVSAITAPKAKGIDNVDVKILAEADELNRLAEEMERLSGEYGEGYARDAHNVRKSEAVVLIGCKVVEVPNIVQPKVYEINVHLALSLINLGIALGSAAKMASILNVDNRIMFTIGVAAKSLGLMDADIVFGIPLSVTSKSIYFDRVWPLPK